MLCVLAIGSFGFQVYARAEREIPQGTEDLSRGEKIFVKYCSGCHGTLGQGDGYKLLGPGPADLTSLAIKQQQDADLLKTIHEGKPNMPPWQLRLSKKDGLDVLAYIRTLSE